ncbi:hypothetical protein [Vulcanisaeta moutnovskia]|nr:hypothetical protein [Vulcanisaeta moutnovskia]
MLYGIDKPTRSHSITHLLNELKFKFLMI